MVVVRLSGRLEIGPRTGKVDGGEAPFADERADRAVGRRQAHRRAGALRGFDDIPHGKRMTHARERVPDRRALARVALESTRPLHRRGDG